MFCMILLCLLSVIRMRFHSLESGYQKYTLFRYRNSFFKKLFPTVYL